MTYETRWYQSEAIESAVAFLTTKPGSPLIAMPTGTGKSLVIAKVVSHFITRYPKMRIAMLTHSKELVGQNATRLRDIHPDIDLGIYSAGLKSKEGENAVIYASVQSVASAIKSGDDPFGTRHLVIVDEAHMIAPGDTTNYRRVFDAWEQRYPTMRVLGLTATPYRMKGGMLTEGEDALFSDVAYDLTSVDSFNRLIHEGYLAPLVAYKPDDEIDLSDVKMTAGDFNSKQAAEAVGREGMLEKACEAIVNRGQDRRSWLIFTSGVENAERVAEILGMHGIPAAAVHSKQPTQMNDEIIADFKEGRLRALVNADMLTTGFDVPQIDLIGMLRPTASAGLWVQMLGRGTRPCVGKTDCLVLDFAGNTARLGPINDPVLPGTRKKKGGGDVPMKVCPVCALYLHTSVRMCPSCGHAFPFETKLEKEASTLELIRRDAKEEKIESWIPRHMMYSVHRKAPGGPASLRVEYMCQPRSLTDYIPWEHGGGAKFVADKWWRLRFPGKSRPASAEEFVRQIENGLHVPQPRHIEVDVANRYKGRVRPDLKKEVF